MNKLLLSLGIFLSAIISVYAKEWKIVLIPDTQIYIQKANYTPIFDSMCEWIGENAEEYNIKLALHLGDITQWNSHKGWKRAKKAISQLDGKLPYVLCVGNHDLGDGNAETRDTKLNEYFKVGNNPLNKKAFYTSYEDGKIENAYYKININGKSWGILALEFGARDEVINWANQVLQENASDNVIVLTHEFIDELSKALTGNGYSLRSTKDVPASPYKYKLGTEVGRTRNCGQEVWDKLISKHKNIEFVFNGHYGDFWTIGSNGKYEKSRRDIATGYRKDRVSKTKNVHQILFNPQFIHNGGDGWIQILTFNDTNNTVKVETFSPFFKKRKELGLKYQDLWRKGKEYNYVIKR